MRDYLQRAALAPFLMVHPDFAEDFGGLDRAVTPR